MRELLELTQALSPTILYWDDFDKGFAGWDSNADGGISRRLSGKLLTWMQEHQYPISGLKPLAQGEEAFLWHQD